VNYLIDVAIGLCQVGNFNSAMAIALGLDSKPVSRLHKVWKKIESAKINILKVIFFVFIFPDFKVGYVFPVVVLSILSDAEFGRDDHREDAPHFTFGRGLMRGTDE